jgi:hypothetical protein
MRVPPSAVGKVGLCPTCGEQVPITNNKAEAQSPRRKKSFFRRGKTQNTAWIEDVSEGARQRFGKAVDLFYRQRYAEALSVFSALLQDHPGNPEIEAGREECLRQMQQCAVGENRKGLLSGPAEQLDLETVKTVVLEKLLESSRDEVQLQAADLALRILAMEKDDTSANDEGVSREDTRKAVAEESSTPEKTKNRTIPTSSLDFRETPVDWA